MLESYVIGKKIIHMKHVHVYLDNLAITFNFLYFETFIRYFKYTCGFETLPLSIRNFPHYFLPSV